MEVAEAIFTILTADATLQALVGNRIYPVIAPQDPQAPLLVHSTQSGEPLNTKDGTYFTEYTVTINGYHPNYDSNLQLMKQVRSVLDGYPFAGQDPNIRRIKFQGLTDLPFNTETNLFGHAHTYFVKIWLAG